MNEKRKLIKQVLDANVAEYDALSHVEAAALMTRQRHVVDPVELVPTDYGVKSIANLLGTTVSDHLVESLELSAQASATIRHTLKILEAGGTVDLASPVVRGMLDAWGANVNLPLTTAEAEAIKTLAHRRESDADRAGIGGVTWKEIKWVREGKI